MTKTAKEHFRSRNKAIFHESFRQIASCEHCISCSTNNKIQAEAEGIPAVNQVKAEELVEWCSFASEPEPVGAELSEARGACEERRSWSRLAPRTANSRSPLGRLALVLSKQVRVWETPPQLGRGVSLSSSCRGLISRWTGTSSPELVRERSARWELRSDTRRDWQLLYLQQQGKRGCYLWAA